jgi:site-specific recombinase XerD
MARRTEGEASAARHRRAVTGWLATQASPNTQAAYRADLELFGTWCAHQGAIPLTADTTALVAFQTARAAAGDSSSTLRRRMSALSSFFDFAVERELVAINPADGVRRPPATADAASSTVRLSAAAIAAHRASAAAIDPRLDALVGLLVCDGLKVAEALALDIDDVHGRSPNTSVEVARRGGTERVPLDQGTARALRRCIGERRSGPVFVSERSAATDSPTRLTRFGADHLIRQLRTDASVAPVTANALRRYHLDRR